MTAPALRRTTDLTVGRRRQIGGDFVARFPRYVYLDLFTGKHTVDVRVDWRIDDNSDRYEVHLVLLPMRTTLARTPQICKSALVVPKVYHAPGFEAQFLSTKGIPE